MEYDVPTSIKSDVIYLDGKWKSNEDDLEAKDSAAIVLGFTANAVNIVADNLEEPIILEVYIGDGYVRRDQAGTDVVFDNEKSFIVVDEPRLYNVIDGEYGDYKLTLISDKGFTFNAFTFGWDYNSK